MIIKFNLKQFLLWAVPPILLGFLSSALSGNPAEIYESLNKPPFSPIPEIFPIIWTVLYIVMGVSAYLISRSDSPHRPRAQIFYLIQLFLNFFWPIIFFSERSYFLAFIWLVLLFVFVVIMSWEFFKVNRTAAFLQLPYLLWLIYASYLNFGVYLYNPA